MNGSSMFAVSYASFFFFPLQIKVMKQVLVLVSVLFIAQIHSKGFSSFQEDKGRKWKYNLEGNADKA